MNKPLLHPRTEAQVKSYIKQPTHALILSGTEGIGKNFVALWLASELKLKHFTLEAEEGKNQISINQIRELYRQTRTGAKLIIIIDQAHAMGHEAQNSFLKLLEEPPIDTKFILITPDSKMLLSTITSRSQIIELVPPTQHQLNKYLSEKYPHTSEAERVSLISSTKGLPAKIINILEESTEQQKHLFNIELAKKFYSSTVYQRHIMLLENEYKKAFTATLLDTLALIIEALIKRSHQDKKTLIKLKKQAVAVEEARSNLGKNGNPKIHLTLLSAKL